MALGVGVSGELIHSPHPEEPIAATAAVGVSKGEGACPVSAAILRDAACGRPQDEAGGYGDEIM